MFTEEHHMMFCYYPYLPPPFQERHEQFFIFLYGILFNGMQIDSFAFFLLASIIMQLESVLNSQYSHTRNSVHYTFSVSHN